MVHHLQTVSSQKAFVKANGIQHVKTVPYHPASNGLVEKAVHTFKTCMKMSSNGSLQDV